MGRYRKKPIVIEAYRWFRNGDHPADYPDGKPDGERPEGAVVRYRFADVRRGFACAQCGNRMREHGWVDTLEGGHTVCPGDWIITGVAGEFYPCKPDIFAATYEPVKEDD